MKIYIRNLTQCDIEPCIKLFQETVHAINAKDYNADQLNIWAPAKISPNDERWQSLLTNISLVAEVDLQIVGFLDMSDSGYLDRLYVHKDHQSKGIARTLLHELERIAEEKRIVEITTEASITAKPFFVTNGYQIYKEQRKLVGSTQFINFLMKKRII